MGTVTEMPEAAPTEEWDGDEPDEQPAEEPRQLQLSMKVGGKKPTTAGLRLVGGKIDVEDEFQKGQTIVLRIEAKVREVAFVDERDQKTGDIVGCARRHKASISGVRVLDVEAA